MFHSKTIFLLFAVLLLTKSCGMNAQEPDGATDASATKASQIIQDTTAQDRTIATVILAEAEIKRLPLRRRTNGLLRARRQIIIKSQAAGEILQAPQEGDYLKKGDILLRVDPRDAQIALARAEALRDEADYRHRELLLRMYNAAGSDTLSPIQKESMLLQSGLPAAEAAVKAAQLLLKRTTVHAAFNGRIAMAQVQAGDLVGNNEEIATLIDLASLEAEFNLLERELPAISRNSRCYVTPTSQPQGVIPATIDILNPQVDEGGLLRARARLGRIPRGLRLYPGMNVEVTVENLAPAAVVVPKAAVVIRSGREVVFVYDTEKGRTDWRYVTILHENDTFVALGEGVEAGESVITSGNLTLDHDIPVHVE